ncbi:MAG: tyrosine/phenylalanine carboxypeptidase domain-containing protein [Patescibacteria group bacterium]
MHLDESLYQIFRSLPVIPFAGAIKAPALNRLSARLAFFKHGTLPRFTYPKAQAFNTVEYLNQLTAVRHQIETLQCEQILKQLYLDKLAELEQRTHLMHAAAQSDDQTVSRISLELYGQPHTDLASFETEFTEKLAKARAGQAHTHQKIINAPQFCALLEAALHHYQVPHCKVKLSPRKRLQCSHNHQHPGLIFRVPKKLLISRKRAERLIAHEIEVHALRRLNGTNSELHLLKFGLAGYQKTEEGLALWHQHRHEHKADHLPGFWDAWATALIFTLGFADAFDRLVQAKLELDQATEKTTTLKQAKLSAWNLCERSSRGISQPGPSGIGYFHDHIYRQGYLEVTREIENHGQDAVLPHLFAGKLGLKDLPALKSLNIRPGELPDNVNAMIVASKLKTSR